MLSFWSLITFTTEFRSSTLLLRASYFFCKSSTSLVIGLWVEAEWFGSECGGLLFDVVVRGAVSAYRSAAAKCMMETVSLAKDHYVCSRYLMQGQSIEMSVGK